MINIKTPDYRTLQFEIHRLKQQVYEQKLTIERLESALSKERSDAAWVDDNRRLDAEAERLRNGGW